MNHSESVEPGFTTGESAMLACLLEAAAPKVGNVHRGADFEDATYYDFVVSATTLGKIFDQANKKSVGELVIESVSATDRLVGTNTNLGMILMFAPLAKCDHMNPRQDIARILDDLDDTDCKLVLQAIRLAKPGGMGKVSSHDIHDSDLEKVGLVELMGMAKDRDSIARQYSNSFREFFEIVVPIVYECLHGGASLPNSIVHAHLKILSQIPDTLIARKCGQDLTIQCSAQASKIVDELEFESDEYFQAISDFDFWLRSDGHRRNPGTSADLLAAALFVGIRSGQISSDKLRRALSSARTQDFREIK